MISKDVSRVFILIFIGMIAALWVYTNFDKNAGMIYLFMAIVALLIYNYSAQLFNHGKEMLIGIDDNIGTDILIGLGVGGAFILLFESTSITMGLPPIYPQATTSQLMNVAAAIMIVGVLAPILEEALFRGAGLYIFDLMMPLIPAIIVVGVIFAGFHWVAYGVFLSAAFIGAFLFSSVACILTLKTKSLVSAVIVHSVINIYLLVISGQLLTIGGF